MNQTIDAIQGLIRPGVHPGTSYWLDSLLVLYVDSTGTGVVTVGYLYFYLRSDDGACWKQFVLYVMYV